MYYELLRAKIADGSAVCGVVGLGYVGLPLAVEMGNVDLKVIGLDVSKRVVNDLNAGKSHIKDIPSADVARLRKAGRFDATTEMSRLAECDVISICVPTPLSKTKDPEMSYVIAATESVAASLRPGQLIVLESTTYPGTTRELMIPLLQARGLEVGSDIFLCFSPERVDPGNEKWHTKNTPKVIGGVTPQCGELGAALYGKFIEHDGAREQPGSRRADEAAREHLPHDQHRAGERDGADLRPPRRRRLGGHRRGGDEAVRLHEVHAGARPRRTLHPARSALSRLEDAHAALQDAHDRRGGRDQLGDAGLLGEQGPGCAERPRQSR